MQSHGHDFLGASHDRNARRLRYVILLSAVTTVAEIVGGSLTDSMALLADGWHMATDTLALMVSAYAYAFARKRAADRSFSWGTGKVSSLAGFASALALGIVAFGILYESGSRFLHPQPVQYRNAMIVAIIGLVVNLASALLLGHGHDHGHGQGHGEEGQHEHGDHDDHAHAHDHNYQSAYLHVLADALTSLLAIFALAAGQWGGVGWLDPVVGVAGGLIILFWSRRLIVETAAVLLDRVPDEGLAAEWKGRIERHGAIIHDWHLWTVGPGRYAAIVSVSGATAADVRERLGDDPRLAHVTVECL